MCLIILVGWVFVFLIPTLTSISKEQKEITHLKRESARVIQAEESYAKLKRSVARYLDGMPTEKTLSTALLSLNSILRHHGVEIDDFYPMQMTKKKCCGYTYRVKPVYVKMTATYEKAMSVLGDLMKSKGLYMVNELTFKDPVFIPPKKVVLDVSFVVDIVLKRGR